MSDDTKAKVDLLVAATQAGTTPERFRLNAEAAKADTQERRVCGVCGEPMPEGEEMFKYHGYSGPCPKPPLPKAEAQERPVSQLVEECRYLAHELEEYGAEDEPQVNVHKQLFRLAAALIRRNTRALQASEERERALRAELEEALTIVVLCGNCGNRYKCKRNDSSATCPCQKKGKP